MGVRIKVLKPWGKLRDATAHDMYALLGVKALPAAGMEPRQINGVTVYVRPLPAKASLHRNWQGLRVMAVCTCGVHVPVGRLHQHKCKGQ